MVAMRRIEHRVYMWIYLLLALLAAVLLFVGRVALTQKEYKAENGVLSLEDHHRLR